MAESIIQITNIPKDRDTPPHMVGNSIFDQPKLKIPLELILISDPIFNGDAPETLQKGLIIFYQQTFWPLCFMGL